MPMLRPMMASWLRSKVNPAKAVGFVELKLHDDKGDLELWLAKDREITAAHRHSGRLGD